MADQPSPKPVVEKLGAKPGQRWILIGASLDAQKAELGALGVTTAVRVPRSADAVILRRSHWPLRRSQGFPGARRRCCFRNCRRAHTSRRTTD